MPVATSRLSTLPEILHENRRCLKTISQSSEGLSVLVSFSMSLDAYCLKVFYSIPAIIQQNQAQHLTLLCTLKGIMEGCMIFKVRKRGKEKRKERRKGN